MIKEISDIVKISCNKKKSDEEKFELALDLIKDMVSYTDLNGKIYYLNSSFAEFLGDSKENIKGKKESDFLHDKIAQICRENNQLVYEKGFLQKIDKIDGKIFETFKSRVSFCEEEKRDIEIFTVIEVKDC